MNTLDKYPLSVLIGLVLLIGSYLFFTGLVLYTPNFSPAVFLPAMGLAIFVFMNAYGEMFAAIRPNKNMYFLGDGTHATIISSEPAGAGRMRYTLSVKPRMAPKYKRYFLGTMEGLTTMLTGEVNMTLEAPSDWFFDIPETQRNPVEGAVIFYGNIHGEFTGAPNDYALKMIAEYNINQKVIQSNIIERLKAVLGYLSKESSKDSITQAQTIYSIVRDLSEAMTPSYQSAIAMQNAVQMQQQQK